MNLFVFGSSLTSTYWNGAATYYRGLYKHLHRLGYRVVFAEPAIYDRQNHRDASAIDYAEVLLYRSSAELPSLLRQAGQCHLVIKHSGVGAHDEKLEHAVLGCREQGARVAFWDVDAPATLARVEANPHDSFRRLIPHYDLILTYGGGQPIVDHYLRLGARRCFPIYNGLDPETHFPVDPDPALACDLAFVGHRLPDREGRVEEFFLQAAALAPDLRFLLGGEGWGDKPLPPNVRWIGHVSSDRHNRVNCSARMVLNVNRDSMAQVGFSPPTRVFEAAGAAACLITDSWDGIETFFALRSEILPAASARDVVGYLRQFGAGESAAIGAAMRRRALREHTYELRAAQLDSILRDLFAGSLAGDPPRKPAAAAVLDRPLQEAQR